MLIKILKLRLTAYECIILLIVQGNNNVIQSLKFLDALCKLIQEILQDSDPFIRANVSAFLSQRVPVYIIGHLQLVFYL